LRISAYVTIPELILSIWWWSDTWLSTGTCSSCDRWLSSITSSNSRHHRSISSDPWSYSWSFTSNNLFRLRTDHRNIVLRLVTIFILCLKYRIQIFLLSADTSSIGTAWLIAWSIRHRIEHFKSTFFLDELRKTLKFKFERRDLLPCLLQLIVIWFYFLLWSLVFFFKDQIFFLHYFFRTGQSMVHQLELIEIFLTVYELVKCILEWVSSFFKTNLLLLLNNIMSFFKLLPLILNLFLILTVLL